MASPQAMAVLRGRSDLTAHRAQQVTREMLKAADLILTMTRRQKEFLLEWDQLLAARCDPGRSALAGKDTAETQDICDPSDREKRFIVLYARTSRLRWTRWLLT